MDAEADDDSSYMSLEYLNSPIQAVEPFLVRPNEFVDLMVLRDLVQKNIVKSEIYQAKRSRYLLKAIKDEDF